MCVISKYPQRNKHLRNSFRAWQKNTFALCGRGVFMFFTMLRRYGTFSWPIRSVVMANRHPYRSRHLDRQMTSILGFLQSQGPPGGGWVQVACVSCVVQRSHEVTRRLGFRVPFFLSIFFYCRARRRTRFAFRVDTRLGSGSIVVSTLCSWSDADKKGPILGWLL